MSFKDHFSAVAAHYQSFRPDYPDELFYHLASLCRSHSLAWDCATGTGQCARQLVRYFEEVIGTDGSAQQIHIAQQNQPSHCTFQVATAEHSGLMDHSVDLICVAQAIHWFDLPAFIAEVRRVLKSQGILAIWTYNLLHIDADLDAQIHALYHDVLGEYWPFERQMVENGYRDLQLPFKELPVPTFDMHTYWDLSQLMGFLFTWSALQRYTQQHQRNPLEDLYPKLARTWGDPEQVKTVHWPLSIRIFSAQRDDN